MTVRISTHFGIVVRKAALLTHGLAPPALLSLMESRSPYDEDDELVSFGPHFGEEAADEFIRRLKAARLAYVDDFFVYTGDVPEWCGISGFVTGETIKPAPVPRLDE